MDGFGKLRAIHVDVHDPCICSKLCPVAGDPVVKPDAQRNDQICIVHGHGGSIVAVHTLHPQETGMVCGDSGKSH